MSDMYLWVVVLMNYFGLLLKLSHIVLVFYTMEYQKKKKTVEGSQNGFSQFQL